MNNLKTGDLLLFNNTSKSGFYEYFSDMIRYGTHSNYTHIGMILKDPTFLNKNYNGLFLWESSYEGIPDISDGKIKVGVQIVPLEEVLKRNDDIFICRQINCDKNLFNDKKLKEINDVVYNKPYDIYPLDWINALLKKDKEPQKTDRFWCSALVGYIYTKVGILNENTDWSILKPCDYSLNGENLNFNKECKLEDNEFKIKYW